MSELQSITRPEFIVMPFSEACRCAVFALPYGSLTVTALGLKSPEFSVNHPKETCGLK